LRFAVEGLKCCLGVKRKETGRKTVRFLLRGLCSPGPPNRAWASPFNPLKFFLLQPVPLLFPQAPVSITGRYTQCIFGKFHRTGFRLHLFGRGARKVVSTLYGVLTEQRFVLFSVLEEFALLISLGHTESRAAGEGARPTHAQLR